jgi:site-specific recombinase XerD
MGLWPELWRFDWHFCRQREVEYKDAADWQVLLQGRIRASGQRPIRFPSPASRAGLSFAPRYPNVERRVLAVREGKNQKDRFVPIDMRALVWIARYVEQAREQLQWNLNERALFISIHGERLNPDSLTNYGRSYIESAGTQKPGSCHLFRHSMATAMLENGAGIRYLQAILGHTNLTVTQIYTRTSLKKV